MTDIEILRVASKISPDAAAFMAAWDAAKESAMGTIAALTAQRDRALEAVEKLREALVGVKAALCDTELNMNNYNGDDVRYLNNGATKAWTVADEAISAMEPTTVDLPKCDHCGAIACGTDCDGSSHYTPEKKE